MLETLKDFALNCFRDLWKAPLWAKGLLAVSWLLFCFYGLRGAGLVFHWTERTYDKLSWKKLDHAEPDTVAHKEHFEYLQNPIYFYNDK
jgi:hypothetical protein